MNITSELEVFLSTTNLEARKERSRGGYRVNPTGLVRVTTISKSVIQYQLLDLHLRIYDYKCTARHAGMDSRKSLPSDPLPSIKLPPASPCHTLYSDLIVAIEYDILLPPNPPTDLISTCSPPPLKTLKSYAVRAIMLELPNAIKSKPLLEAWIESVTSPSIPENLKEVLIEGLRGMWPRCANRIFGRDPRASLPLPISGDDLDLDIDIDRISDTFVG